jgi:hypothetical protein
VREGREQPPLVSLHARVVRLPRASAKVHGKFRAPAFQLALVHEAQTEKRERERRRRREARVPESLLRARLVVILDEARETTLVTQVRAKVRAHRRAVAVA